MKKKLLFVVTGIVLLVVGFFAGYEYRGYVIASAMTEAFKNFGSTDTASVNNPTDVPEQKIVTVEKGQEGKLSTLSIKVNSLDEEQSMPQSFGQPVSAKEGTKFVVVEITATNLTNSPFDFPSDIVLVDGQGREFRVDVLDYNPKDSIVYKNLQPSISETGTLAYMVPEDSKDFTLDVVKASTNELFKFRTQ